MSWRVFGVQLARQWNEDSLGDTAAALTYYAVLALFPFLLFVTALGALWLDPRATQSLTSALARIAPADAVALVEDRLVSLSHNRSGGLVTIGIAIALWSASNAVMSLMEALNRCYDVRETRPYWRRHALSILVTIGSGIVGLVISAVLFFPPLVGSALGFVGPIVIWLRFPLAAALTVLLWSALYWVLPNVRPRFQVVSVGAVVAVVLWLVASWGLTEYVRHSPTYEATYGTIGAAIVLLVWMWFSSVALLIGAEVNKVLTPADRLRTSATGDETEGSDRSTGKAAGEKPRLSIPKPRPA